MKLLNFVLTILFMITFWSMCIAQSQIPSSNSKLNYENSIQKFELFEDQYGEFIDTENARIHYIKIGKVEESCILWLHGTYGSSYDFISYAEKLDSNGIGSIAIDYYGHGQTTLYNETASIYHLADDIKELFVHENLESCIIVGVSRGGTIATAFYDEYPDLLKGIALIDGGSVPWVINVQKLSERDARQRIGSFSTPTDTLFDSKEQAFAFYNYLDENNSWKTLNRIQKTGFQNDIFWTSNYGLRRWLRESSLDEIMDGAYRSHTLPPFAASNLLIDPKIVYRNLDIPLLIVDPVKKGDWLMDFKLENERLKEMHGDKVIHKIYKDANHNILYYQPDRLLNDLQSFFKIIK